MPRYRITSPEGKTVTVEGNKPPTEQDIAAIFGQFTQPTQQPEQPQQDAYSGLDKAKYTLRAAGEGASLGLGDIAAGTSNVMANDLADVTHGRNVLNRLKGATGLLLHGINPVTQFIDLPGMDGNILPKINENFKQGRREFVEEQKDFAKAHPGLNFGGEMVGGLITGIGGAGKKVVTSLAKPTLLQMAKSGGKTGIKEGFKFGTVYGAGSGATEDADKISVKNALIGAGTGGVGGAVLGGGLGFAMPYGIAGALGAWNLGKKAVGNVANALRNKTINALQGANKELVEQAVKEGKPLIDIADRQLMDVAESANMLNPKAKQTFADYSQQRIEGQHPKLVETLGEYFDPKGSHQLADELQADINKGAKVLYDKAVYQLDKAGNILVDEAGNPVSKVLPELEKLTQHEADYISKVYGTKGIAYEVQGLPQNDMRVLNYAKQLMDDDIQRLLNRGENSQARILAEKRAQFIDKIDKANPEYKAARAFFERGKRAEDALQAGKKALSGERSNLEYDYGKLNPEEKFYYRKGVGNALEELSNQKTEGGNIYQRVFNAENRRRLKGLEIPNYDKLEQFARAESKAASNINTLRGGSPTTPRQEMIKRFLKRPYRMARALAIDTVLKPFAANPAEIARAMTDPQYLAQLYAKAGKGNTNNSVMQVLNKMGTKAGGTAAAEPSVKISDVLKSASNKLKEEGGYAMKPLEDTQTAYHGTGVRGIKQFDTAFMGTGEGPQAHGWGSYFTNRNSAERYRRKLMYKDEINKIQAKYDPLLEQASKEAQSKYEKLYELWQNGKITGEEYSKKVDEVSKKEWELLRDKNREIDKLLATDNARKGQVYEVEIPSNDVLLDEQKTFSEQPKKVQEAINKLREKYPDIRTGHKGLWIYKDVVREGPYKNANQNKRWASETLNKYGIKGIAYDGRQDGRSFVIFNPMKDTKINRTFYSVLMALASAGLLNKTNDKERK